MILIAMTGPIAMFGLARADSPASSALRARVVWAHAARVYVAALDSTSSARLVIGATIEFVARGKTVASGDVTGALGRELVVAELTSGSLEKQKHLDRVGVIAHAPPSAPLPTLRVGFPSRRRANLLFSCETMGLRPPFAPGVYRADTLSASKYRWVSPSAVPGSSTFPDTIYAHLFDDSADEEIALERGDINVAVFWPGELSRHMREHPAGFGWILATRMRGVVAAMPLDPPYRGVPGVDTLRLSKLNEDLFRNDLGPSVWNASTSDPSSRPQRFDVDSLCPGREALERSLNSRASSGGNGRDSSRIVRLFYVDASTIRLKPMAIMLAEYAAANARSDALRARADSIVTDIGNFDIRHDPAQHWAVFQVGRELGAIPVFTIRCPIACTSELRSRLTTLSRELVDLMDCGTPTVSP